MPRVVFHVASNKPFVTNQPTKQDVSRFIIFAKPSKPPVKRESSSLGASDSATFSLGFDFTSPKQQPHRFFAAFAMNLYEFADPSITHKAKLFRALALFSLEIRIRVFFLGGGIFTFTEKKTPQSNTANVETNEPISYSTHKKYNLVRLVVTHKNI